jgi:hypothetical protein
MVEMGVSSHQTSFQGSQTWPRMVMWSQLYLP